MNNETKSRENSSPIFLEKGGEIIKLNQPENSPDEDGKNLVKLISFAAYYQKLINLGWQRTEGIKFNA